MIYSLIIIVFLKLLLPSKSSHGSVGKVGQLLLFLAAAIGTAVISTNQSQFVNAICAVSAIAIFILVITIIKSRSREIDRAEMEAAAVKAKVVAENRDARVRLDGVTRSKIDPIGRRGMAAITAQEVMEQQSRWR